MEKLKRGLGLCQSISNQISRWNLLVKFFNTKFSFKSVVNDFKIDAYLFYDVPEDPAFSTGGRSIFKCK
jgi:hypothetical protein